MERVKRILYSNGSFLTGDQIAHTLLQYATELARAETADLVDVPTLGEDGVPQNVEVVIGPSSQLLSKDEPSSFDEPSSQTFSEDIGRRTAELGIGRPVIQPHAGPPTPFFDDLDI